MRITLVLAAIALAGCAAPPPRSPYYSECEYEAEKATPPSRSVFADVMHKHDLITMCIRQKGG